MRFILPQTVPCSSCMRARIIPLESTQRRTSGASLWMYFCRRGIMLSLIVRTRDSRVAIWIGMRGRYVYLPSFLPSCLPLFEPKICSIGALL